MPVGTILRPFPSSFFKNIRLDSSPKTPSQALPGNINASKRFYFGYTDKVLFLCRKD
jgi:hypothetical protein